MINLGIFLFQKAEDAEEKVNVFKILYGDGELGNIMGLAIVAILFVLSVIALYIFMERWTSIKKAGKVDETFLNNIRASVAAGNLEGAKAICRNVNSPYARMIEKGIQRIGKPLRDINASIENVGNLEVFKLEKNLSTLASIAGAAPRYSSVYRI